MAGVRDLDEEGLRALDAAVYHEQQVGALCAQHCVNSLLQESFFTVEDFANVARSLDEREAAAMAEGGDPAAYAAHLRGGSQNMDDSGFFSVQVISNVLQPLALSLTRVGQDALSEPADAFILNHHEHWIALRRFGTQWYNLDSTLPRPARVSDTYLHLLLSQLQVEGYTVFGVDGPLPAARADAIVLKELDRMNRPPPAPPAPLTTDEIAIMRAKRLARLGGGGAS